jgi:hypothetical protein
VSPAYRCSVDAVNAHADQLIDAKVLHSERARIADLFRGYVVDAHGYQFVGVGMLVSQALQPINKFRRNTVDSEGDHLFEVHVIVPTLLEFFYPFRLSRKMITLDQTAAPREEYIGYKLV